MVKRWMIWLVAIFMVCESGISYGACEVGHWVSEKIGSGEIIRLEDGSLWEIDSIDRIDTSLWLPTDNIIICDDQLINSDSGDKVGATPLR
ncbi:MAG: hypothetical protein HQL75_09665 [Magnetococcales bacterium]|nr:hypothetical protein [Magnetococcales bacterium]